MNPPQYPTTGRRHPLRLTVAIVGALALGALSALPATAGASSTPPPSTIPVSPTGTPASSAPSTTTTTTVTAPAVTPTTDGVIDSGEITDRYIVTLKAGINPTSVANESRWNGDRVDHVYRSATRGFAGDLSATEVARLESDPRVERVERDQVVHIVGTQTNPPSWGLDRIDERARDGVSSYTYPSTGVGVTAYVIDTGIYSANADFGGRVAQGVSFSTSSSTEDCNGHGTHVAGTIGGSTYGIAKGVTLVPVRVLDCAGRGYWSDVVAGLDWVTAQHTTGMAVANLSLGGGYSQSVNDAVARAVADGVIVAVAAGNSNADACSSSPASTPTALTVGATDSSDNRAPFSNYGTCVDLFAPGVGITSDWIGSPGATNTISGTSMASPHVAGVAALYLAAGKTATNLMADVSTGYVVNPGTGSPNKLVYLGSGPCTGCSTTTTSTPTASTSTTAGPTTTTTTRPTTTTTTQPPVVDTGWRSPTANGADPGGDGNGYESNPANAYADDGRYAVDTNSGTSSATSCTSPDKDKHGFAGYGVSVPKNAKGIEVQLQARAESTTGSPKLCVQLSWDGGTTWTTAKTTATLRTTERTFVLGSPSDLWGRSSWTPSELTNLRVRVIDSALSTARDFSLDVVAVRVTY